MNRFYLLPFFAAVILAFTIISCSGDDRDGAPDILECTGSCSCDEQSRSCTCSGGTTCAIEGVDDITFYCAGNAACDLTCGLGCHVVCPGTTGCTVQLGLGGTAECQGNAVCEYFCEGDCTASCGGSSSCTMNCADACTVEGTSCRC